jgi:hypothetical protein
MKIQKKKTKTIFDSQDPKTFAVPSVYVYDDEETTSTLMFYHCGELVSVEVSKSEALKLVKELIKAEEISADRQFEKAKDALADISGLAEQMENASKVSS